MESGIGAFGHQSPVTVEMMDKYTEDIAVDGSRFKRGNRVYTCGYDLHEGGRKRFARCTVKQIK